MPIRIGIRVLGEGLRVLKLHDATERAEVTINLVVRQFVVVAVSASKKLGRCDGLAKQRHCTSAC